MARLITDRWNGAVRIRFNAPECANALDLSTVLELHRVLLECQDEIVLIGSTNPRIFSAGADIKVENDVRKLISDELYGCYRTMITRPCPVIAVVEGTAVGGGAQLATAADFRIAGPGARWRWVGPGHGIVVGGWILPTLVGRGRSFDFTLTSRWVSSEDAVACGLVSCVCNDPWTEAARLVEQLAELDPVAVNRLKQLSLDGGLLAALDSEREGNRQWDGRAPKSLPFTSSTQTGTK